MTMILTHDADDLEAYNDREDKTMAPNEPMEDNKEASNDENKSKQGCGRG